METARKFQSSKDEEKFERNERMEKSGNTVIVFIVVAVECLMCIDRRNGDLKTTTRKYRGESKNRINMKFFFAPSLSRFCSDIVHQYIVYELVASQTSLALDGDFFCTPVSRNPDYYQAYIL